MTEFHIPDDINYEMVANAAEAAAVKFLNTYICWGEEKVSWRAVKAASMYARLCRQRCSERKSELT